MSLVLPVFLNQKASKANGNFHRNSSKVNKKKKEDPSKHKN
jgi:hypothetical protein